LKPRVQEIQNHHQHQEVIYLQTLLKEVEGLEVQNDLIELKLDG
jgi:hypothetical protein